MDRISSIAETTIHLAFVTTKLCLYDRWQCISLEIKKEELTETMEKSGVLCHTHKRRGWVGQAVTAGQQ